MTTPDDLPAPRPEAYLRIGVTGHRPGAKLSPPQADAVRRTVDRILAEVASLTRDVVEREAWAFSSRRPDISVVSPVAEGADRIVAEAGLAAGFGLSAILPFARADYRLDFESEASRLEYDRLLAKSLAVFELDGKRDAAARAYEAAGLLMLANADIVLAIWDQMPAEGIGGTALIVEQAMAADVPVVLIDPREPDAPAILWRADSALPTAREGIETVPRRPLGNTLTQVIEIIVGPPKDPHERGPLEELLREREHRWNIALAYPAMLFLLGVRRMRWSDLHAPLQHQDSGMRWRQYLQGHLDDAAIRPVDTDLLNRSYSFIDRLSSRYAQIYRSAYVFNYIAGAAAVLLASIGLIYPSPDIMAALNFKAVMVGIEIGLIASILVTLNLGTRRQWHRRWLQYRRLAETLRQLRMLAPTAAAARLDRPSDRAGRAYGWVSWYARAVEREIPVPNVAVSDAYLAAVRDAVSQAELKSQVSWNEHNAEAMETAGHRLHVAGTLLFWATLAICIIFLALYFVDIEEAETLRELTVFLTALFPAIGAALSAIRSQADFETVARRSHETARDLDELDEALNRELPEFARLTDRIEKAVDVMMADNAEWHVLFRTRPLSLPRLKLNGGVRLAGHDRIMSRLGQFARGLGRFIPADAVRPLGRPAAVFFHGVERATHDPRLQSNHHDEDAFRDIALNLKANFDVLPLDAVGDVLKQPDRFPRAVFLMSDDGYANTLTVAADILEDLALPWTLAVSTHHIETGERNPIFLAQLFAYRAPAGRYAIPHFPQALVLGDGRDGVCEQIVRHLRSLDMVHAQQALDAILSHFEPAALAALLTEFASERFLNWDQVRQLAKRGVGIAAHAHRHWPMNEHQSPALLRTQAQQPKALIEREVGPCRNFVYPFGNIGDISRAAWQAVRDAGYENGFTTLSGTLDAQANRFLLPRYGIAQDAPHLTALISLLRAGNRRVNRFQHALAG